MDNLESKKRQEEYSQGEWLIFDNIRVGMEFPPVEFELTEELIEKYCRAMGDDSPVYTDEKVARTEGYSGRIAPATIVCIYAIPTAILSGYKPRVIPPPGNIHYRQEYEFVQAAKAGDKIRVKSVVVNKETRKGRNYVTIESEYLNQNGKKIAIGRITPIWAK
jgi:acyl dehydratase